MAKQGKPKKGLLNVKDIAKGFTSSINKYDLITLAPIQCVSIDEKDEDWIIWNADWHEALALRELPSKATKQQKFYDMAAGVINKSDYIYNPTGNDVSEHLGIIGGNNEETLLEMFFPIVPVILNEFIAEFINSDRDCIVDAVDDESKNEAIEYRTKLYRGIVEEYAMKAKEMQLIKEGIIPTENMDQKMAEYYQFQMESAQKIAQAETQFKKFRNEAAKWGNRFIDKFREKHYFTEIELKMFMDSLIVDEAMVALNMHENDFTPKYLEPRKTYVNISPSKTYYSDATSITTIDFMTLGEAINAFRKDLTDEQIVALEQQYGSLFNSTDILFANQEGHYSTYYDTTKTYLQNQAVPANIQEAISDENVRQFFKDVVGGGANGLGVYTGMFSNPKLIRVSETWWLSQRKYGILTKIEKDGSTTVSEIDEYFKVTEPPQYDNSLLKEKTSRTLIKGEHVDWTWIPEWRYVVKLGQNHQPNMKNSTEALNSIYLYGDKTKFQFKGNQSEYGAKPPVEGRRMSEKTSISNGLVQKVRPWQILHNVINNKILKLMPYDVGPVIVANESSLKTNSLNYQDGREPLTEYFDNIRENRVIVNKDLATGLPLNGKTIPNSVLDISTIEKMQSYVNLGAQVAEIAYRTIGFTPQRLGDVGRKETARGVEQATQSSQNQTQIYFERFSNMLMPRVWQTIIEAGQYYTTQYPEFADTYITDEGHKVVFSILRDKLLLRDLLVKPVSTIKVKNLMQRIQQIAMTDPAAGFTPIDKINALKAHTPSEAIEKLQEAEAKRIENERAIQEQQDQLKAQEMQMIEKREREKMAMEEKHFYDNLASEEYRAELMANKVEPPAEPQGVSPTDSAKLAQQGEIANQNASLQNRKLSQSDKQFAEKNALEREKLSQKDRESQRNYQIAVENKQSADIQFEKEQQLKRQQLRNKPKAKN